MNKGLLSWKIFVEVYEHDSNLDRLDDLDDGLKARVVVDGWMKMISRPQGKELYDLQSDPDDRNDLAAANPEKVLELSGLIDAWIRDTSLESLKPR